MADEIFENPRLVSIYDAFDGQRHDLDLYVSIVQEFSARSIVDIGCGTGCLAVRLAGDGLQVTAIDPASVSVEYARRKQDADKVRWIVGDVTQLPKERFDLAVMTGNVAQVFLSDEEWARTLTAIRARLADNGHLVFEARDPARQAWLDWTREKTYQQKNIQGAGIVEGWCDVLDAAEDLVRFRWTYVFASDGKTLTSDSILRFRSRKALEGSLLNAGYSIMDIRDAPDRTGKEFVFIAVVK